MDYMKILQQLSYYRYKIPIFNKLQIDVVLYKILQYSENKLDIARYLIIIPYKCYFWPVSISCI